MSASQKLGQYTLIEKIAQGGMAQVFKARTTDTNGFERLVVIKRILPHISEDPEYVDMLANEAKIAVHFTHGNIAQIYDLGRVKRDYYIVMEYVDGRTLSQAAKKLKQRGARFPLDILLYCGIEVCRALSYIHNKIGPDGKNLGVVHRDISPQNVILSYSGNIKIIDFGVAKARVSETQTESGVLKGKFGYMSPEQARGDVTDHRSDIFSFGILMWELITGERLFKRKTNHETVQAVQKAKVAPCSNSCGDVPKELDKILKKALQKNPRKRFQDARDMGTTLEKLLFKMAPDFKPVDAAAFLYKLFGPEDDEKDLPIHPFFREPTLPTRVVGDVIQDEITVKDESREFTPVMKVPRLKPLAPFLWMAGFAVFVLVCGMIYVYLAGRLEAARLVFVGLESNMVVMIGNEPLHVQDNQMQLKPDVTHVIRIVKPGHESFTTSVTLKSGETRTLQVVLKQLPPQTGDIIVTTTPPGATVYVNNMEWKGTTPLVIRHLKADGQYRIGLYLKDHQFHTQEVKVIGGGDVKVEHTFNSRAENGEKIE